MRWIFEEKLHCTGIMKSMFLLTVRAAWNNQKGVAEELLKKGAQIESRNFFGYSPLHLAGIRVHFYL